VVSGAPATAICETAEKIGADLIVMGTHGRTGIAHVFLGSVAERTIRHAPCPVLTVRGSEHGAAHDTDATKGSTT
jgi:universal stress protein A